MRQQLLLLSQLRGHVLLFLPSVTQLCGSKTGSLHCPSYANCPTGGSGPDGCGGPSGPLGGDPVNLATGEEEYQTAPDITVYNPHGPPVVWQRRYNSLRPVAAQYESDDHGIGWSQTYNVSVQDNVGLILNPQIPQGGSLTFPNTSTGDFPATDLTWDILLNGSTIATSASPNSWTVSFNGYNFTISAPSSANSTINYKVRYVNSSGTFAWDAFFDVLAPSTVPQGAQAAMQPSGHDAPGTGLNWDIVQNGTTIASSTQPSGFANGWQAFCNGPSNAPTLYVTVPMFSTIAANYEARVNYQGTNWSVYFNVIATR